MTRTTSIAAIFALALAPHLANAQSASPPAQPAQTPERAPAAAPQGNTVPTPTAPATAANKDSTPAASEGIRMANTATLAVRFVTVKPADVMASKLIGATVYNNQNESLGTVEDMVIDGGKTVSGVVVSVGGFLGLGESYVVLDPSTVVINQRDGVWRAFVDTSKDTLKNAPKFSYTRKGA